MPKLITKVCTLLTCRRTYKVRYSKSPYCERCRNRITHWSGRSAHDLHSYQEALALRTERIALVAGGAHMKSNVVIFKRKRG